MKDSNRLSVICAAAAACAAVLTLACASQPKPAATEPKLATAEPKPVASEPNEVAVASLVAQEAGLRTSLAQTAAVIVRAAGVLELRYPVRLAFVPDGAELLPTGMAMLDLLAHSLREYEHTEIVVAVYTDAIGSSEYNQQQAQQRAAAVAAYLQAKGVAPARLIARGVGESAPLEAPDTPEGRDLNRRLELAITPLSS